MSEELMVAWGTKVIVSVLREIPKSVGPQSFAVLEMKILTT
jgi:hypothetical protein